ncbi:uncharacterized protein [Venturia canescens]|uniref:uncharacterized protein n=1 Tax=Venturia canescens TaxID=32260 RepID=UPI001C9BBEBD|nr:uncharacterized protein LOC122410794 [Venturia canescens]
MSMRVTKLNGDIYEIRTSKPCHLSDVLRIMRENFYYEETMFKSLCANVKIDDEKKQRINAYFDGTVIAALEASPCIIAVHKKTGKIVGVNIITVSENPKIGSKKDGLATIFAVDGAPPVVKKYIEYLSRINEQVDLFEVFPNVQTMWEFYAVAIDKDHRKLGLASDLMNFGINIAKQSNVSLVFGVFTSIYSRKSAEKIAMKSFVEFDLTKYVEPDGRPVFNNIQNDNIVTVMVLEM